MEPRARPRPLNLPSKTGGRAGRRHPTVGQVRGSSARPGASHADTSTGSRRESRLQPKPKASPRPIVHRCGPVVLHCTRHLCPVPALCPGTDDRSPAMAYTSTVHHLGEGGIPVTDHRGPNPTRHRRTDVGDEPRTEAKAEGELIADSTTSSSEFSHPEYGKRRVAFAGRRRPPSHGTRLPQSDGRDPAHAAADRGRTRIRCVWENGAPAWGDHAHAFPWISFSQLGDGGGRASSSMGSRYSRARQESTRKVRSHPAPAYQTYQRSVRPYLLHEPLRRFSSLVTVYACDEPEPDAGRSHELTRPSPSSPRDPTRLHHLSFPDFLLPA
ncbi:hypothetical protein SETIT_6G204900v2 [Setaria italica]|uniref:Uncharacterized protein n=1 Tax=Setaria italica TaxID=4555 RepID=A0A368RQC2_SETIT|nr:hypothetical protein SETIT_6G204900v2 [Setaria italica]RCV31770.1 hypothetical protein SETIT_6G204900v2 [Setaria italica]